MRQVLAEGIDALEEATDWVVTTHPDNNQAVAAGAVPYLKLLGIVAGGWLMARGALAAAQYLDSGDGDQEFCQAKLLSVRFYADQVLIQAPSLAATVTRGWAAVGRFQVGGI